MFAPETWALFRETRHRGALPGFDGEGWAGSRANGLYIRIQVKVENAATIQAKFETVGCLATIATCEALLRWVLAEPGCAPTAGELDARLGGLPEARKFCLEMALHALQKAHEAARNQ
ncbi:MAG: iron-sulfur cluster assembly scaffold protein [Candidatus Eremiobacteraeota bacterium]|nr:iron-sulfur cluster assembly scaffold protein [Candidatus Eremiobacteraeota bacterium]